MKPSLHHQGRRTILTVVFLLACNLVAHFVPFERASIGNDDFVHWVTARNLSPSEILALTPRQPDRPLTFLLLMFQERWMDGNATLGLWAMVVSSSVVLLLVFGVLRLLLRSHPLATLGTLIFILLPQKLEVYHIPVYLTYDIANACYLLSLSAFIMFSERSRRSWLILSVLSYSAGLLLYETGFFLPLVLVAYCVLRKRPGLPAASWFLVPLLLYSAFRLTDAFGFAVAAPVHEHRPNLLMVPRNLADVFHHYAGRYLTRNLLYGASAFFQIEWPWLAGIVALNLVLLVVAHRYYTQVEWQPMGSSIPLFAAGMSGWFVLPALLSSFGGVGGRQLVLASVGVAILGLWCVERARRRWRAAFLPLTLVALIVCQGNAWAQVVACRINNAVYETMRESHAALQAAERIVIDTRSFADQIPYTWRSDSMNVLNTYYGAQAFEDWGLASMARSILGHAQTRVYVVSERPQLTGDGMLRIDVRAITGYRHVERSTQVIPREGTLIIGFQDVYRRGYDHGARVHN